jgi:aldehyde:ferredoxin oxidoreductase
MSSYGGSLLRINLTTREATTETLPERVKRDFLGGRGFGIKYLYDEVPAGTDPLGPENRLIFANGPLTATKATSCSRWVVYTKSPLTGTVMRAVSGGPLGVRMKWAGLDLVIVEGQADEPVYVYVDEKDCKILDAGGLWGKGTAESQEAIEQSHGRGVGIGCIGPAGENRVLYASIVSGRRTASRGGVGAVMGAKNLKAIVIKASMKKGDYDHAAFDQLAKEQIENYRSEQNVGQFTHFSMYGTGSAEYPNFKGFFPTRNFRYGVMEGYQKLTHVQFGELAVKHDGCYNCIVRCGKVRTVQNGPYAGATNEGPEYESLWAFSGPIENTDIGSLIAVDALCDDLGLDTISTGGSIGFAFELFEKGLISKEDTDGLALIYGDHRVLLPLVRKIAYREGFGDFLANGVKRMANQIGKGSMDYAMHAKGMELPAYEPRALKGMGFGLATSNIGGSQNYSYAFQEIWEVPFPRKVEPQTEEGKADITRLNQEWSAVFDSAVACLFTTVMGFIRVDMLAKLLAVGTGTTDYSNPGYLRKVGERICNLERAFNVREGFRRKDDTLPRRVLTEALLKGPAEGQVVRSLDAFLDGFYDECGWTREGIPTVEKLRELGLEQAIRDIQKAV